MTRITRNRPATADGSSAEDELSWDASGHPLLSPRECQVLQLLAMGAKDRQIAEVLSVSPATVQTHIRNAKAKLNARTRTHAIALALREGAISFGETES
jgi:DNA-binding NarL/FixJ family response regulator